MKVKTLNPKHVTKLLISNISSIYKLTNQATMSVAGHVVRFTYTICVPEGQHETVVPDTINMILEISMM
jgi:hypothetical protein